MNTWGTYDRFMKIYGDTLVETTVNQAKETFLLEAVENPGYRPNCTRNGKPQRFLVERTDVPYKAKFVTFPDEEIYPGDVVECDGYIFIIIEPPRFLDRINWAAVGRLSNMTLHWQDFAGNICTSPVCLDAGVYSTTMNGTDTVQAPDKQFKLYLPFNEETATLHLEQRIAVDTRYDKFGNVILECYRITGMSRVARTYGAEGHLLVCELRSSTYSPEHDNVELMICDYRSPKEELPVVTELPCEISGRAKISIGKSQKYTAKFYAQDMSPVDDVTAAWDLSALPSSVSALCVCTDNVLTLKVPKDEDLIGETLIIGVSAQDSESYAATMEIEVVS